METNENKTSTSTNTWAVVLLVFSIMYFAFPVVLLYPVIELKDSGKNVPEYIIKPIGLAFMPVFYLIENSKTYEKWISWQAKMLGIK